MAESRPSGSAWRWSAALAFAIPMWVFTTTAAPGPYWLDSSEFVAALWVAGNPHPPGHPLYAALGQAAVLAPIGSVALRTSLLSALFGALSCLILWFSARSILSAMAVPRARSSLIALGAALLAGSSYAIWFQSVRAEVYTLHLLLAAGLFALAVEAALQSIRGVTVDRRLLFTMALVGGLALGNHHYLTLFVLVPVGLFLVSGRATRRALAPASWPPIVGLGLLGLSVYVWLPLRAIHNPLVNWGYPDNLGDFGWMVTARMFQQALGASDARPALLDVAVNAVGISAEQVTPVGLVVAMAGIVALLRGRYRGLGILALSVVLCNLLTQGVFKTFQPNNPDVHGYFALTAWVLALAVAVAVGTFDRLAAAAVAHDPRLKSSVAQWLSALAIAMLAAMVGFDGLSTLPRARLDGFHDVEVFSRAALDNLPPDALLFTSDFQTCFNLWYGQGVEGQRPDVAVIHRTWLNEPTYMRSISERHPEARALVLNPGKSYALNLDALRETAKTRPVYVEVDDSLQSDLRPFLLADGLFSRLMPAAVPAGPVPEPWRRAQIGFWRDLDARLAVFSDTVDPETKAAMTWRHFLGARANLAEGHRGLATFHLDQALRLDPEAPELHAIADSL